MFILINKPTGPTSHDIIDQLRKITGEKKIGHAGTLDPLASGLLIIAITRNSTKLIDSLIKQDKIYQTTFQLGATSTTYDSTGTLSPFKKIAQITQLQIINLLQTFKGKQSQIPPIYSAKKINGKKAYELARQGKFPKLKPQHIAIYNIQLDKFDTKLNQITITVHCSSGTYIRSLVSDIGKKLNTGAYLTKLNRTHIGGYNLSSAINIDELTPQNWQRYTFNP